MADRQFLRIGLTGVDYLLPNSISYVIEKRENLELNNSGSACILAWQTTRSGRAPAYSVDADLNPVQRPSWQKAVFFQAGNRTLGLVADELQLLTREDERIEPFIPPGPAYSSGGHLFNGAWVRSGQLPILVFEPRVLAEYLVSLERPA